MSPTAVRWWGVNRKCGEGESEIFLNYRRDVIGLQNGNIQYQPARNDDDDDDDEGERCDFRLLMQDRVP